MEVILRKHKAGKAQIKLCRTNHGFRIESNSWTMDFDEEHKANLLFDKLTKNRKTEG